ncbi:hypothetical protein NECAME_07258 [Necator americanus]|uniref:Uncharacterized protein n=1 Tax=Necator americanus TaxID=51031 RepID=W2TRF8_NECAM|nr:hypothetical protein NECAME_07258 [Necator americanus]ETN83716.1 hypothetical protein NECAME_07258 [Necator americanus]
MALAMNSCRCESLNDSDRACSDPLPTAFMEPFLSSNRFAQKCIKVQESFKRICLDILSISYSIGKVLEDRMAEKIVSTVFTLSAIR